MSSAAEFLGRFGGQGEPLEETLASTLPSTSGTLDSFLDKFSTLTEEYLFYKGTETLKYDVVKHVYFRVNPELGNLEELHGVTGVLKIIDKSAALVPWSSKMCVEKLLRTIPLGKTLDEFGSIQLAPLTLAEFTKLCLEAKSAHKEHLEVAGDIGHAAHKCLEDSIKYALQNTQGVVQELRDLPEDEKAQTCAKAAFAWMQAHEVCWLHTEQKIYSKAHRYAGTLDGLAEVSSCEDLSCCTEKFSKSLSIIDFKTSNALRTEYVFQLAAYEQAEREEKGTDIERGFILRLPKDLTESRPFQVWPVLKSEFADAFQAFLTCIKLIELIDLVTERMSSQKKAMKETKKVLDAEAKVLAKAQAKVQREAAKAQLRLDRAAERARIKEDAKKARETAKHAKISTKTVLASVRPVPALGGTEVGPSGMESAALPHSVPEPSDTIERVVQIVEEHTKVGYEKREEDKHVARDNPVVATVESSTDYEAGTVVVRKFNIPEEE